MEMEKYICELRNYIYNSRTRRFDNIKVGEKVAEVIVRSLYNIQDCKQLIFRLGEEIQTFDGKDTKRLTEKLKEIESIYLLNQSDDIVTKRFLYALELISKTFMPPPKYQEAPKTPPPF
jgi:hypothetical protein